MGYEIHLERDQPIGEEEWRAAVAAEPSLRLRELPFAEVENPLSGEKVRIETSPLDALGEGLGFRYDPARVSFTARGFEPGGELWELVFRLAGRLGARVVGDEGELYPEGG